MRYYHRQQVNVERVWYGREGAKRVQFVDVKVLGSGKKIEGIKASELSDEPKAEHKKVTKTPAKKSVVQVSFAKKGEVTTLEYDSNEYDKFIEDNQLNKTMVTNCLNGVVKTHKGYTIKYI